MDERSEPGDWAWPDELDAVTAAPASHRVLLENDRVRVVDVSIDPGVEEPLHTHRWPSVMLVVRPARLLYRDPHGVTELAPRTSADGAGPPSGSPWTEWMEPEGPHAVANIDTSPYRAFRIELKGAEASSA